MKTKLEKYSHIVIGIFLVSFAFNLFLSPYDFVTGGVSGLSIIIRHFIPLNESLFMILCNALLLIISYFLLGKEKTKNTLVGSLLFPIGVYLTKNISNYLIITIDPLLIAIIGGVLSGYGYGLIFQNNYTTGGTDILNQIMEKYFHMPMGKSILIVDGFIVLLGGFTFGFTKLIYSLISLYFMSYYSNNLTLGINKNKVLYISSKKIDDIKKYLFSCGYDVTLINSAGAFTKKENQLLMCSLPNLSYHKVKEVLKEMDKDVFIVVTSAYEQKNANQEINKLTLETNEC